MELKEKLKQYNDIILEIKYLKKKLKQTLNKANLFSVVEESVKHPPFQKHIITICHACPSRYKKAKYYEKELKKRYVVLMNHKSEIEEFIEKLPTPRLRMIFEFRYIEHCTWQQVAVKIGGNSTGDSVRMEHDRYLNS